jgi:hypothetical protein
VLRSRLNTDARIDFVEFAFSLESPYRDMGRIEATSPAQRARLVGLYEGYCAGHTLAAAYLPDEEIGLRCRAARERAIHGKRGGASIVGAGRIKP